MLANSEFITMLNQAATDRLELAKLLGISETQLSFVTNADAGQGLLKCAGNIVPFEDKYPINTKLYKLMTTKPKDLIPKQALIMNFSAKTVCFLKMSILLMEYSL